MHDARWHFQMLHVVERLDQLGHHRFGAREFQMLAINVDLQRTNARREIDDARMLHRLQLQIHRVNPEAQRDVEHQRAELDEQVAVAGGSEHDFGS